MTYEQYKDSGIDWIGQIPEHWECKRLGNWFEERRKKVSDKDYAPLSVTKNGIVPQLDSAAKSNDGDNRKLVKAGDFVINSRSDRKGSSGLSYLDGSVSLINIVMKPRGIYPKFSEFLLKSNGFIEEFYRNGHGIVADLWTTRYDEMKFIFLAIPPIHEQEAIANFLDDKTAKIDALVQTKEQQIEKLKELRQAKIHHAVTKGLPLGFDSAQPTNGVEMKDSGIEWIGEIPKHWEVKRLKNVAMINKNVLPETFSKFNEIEYVDIGSVNLVNGIEKTEKFLFKDAPSRARRIAKNNDTIISTVRTYLKAIDFIDNSKSEYIFSTGFAILEPNGISPKFLANSVRSDYFTDQVTYNSKGMSYPAINSTDLSCLWLSIPPIQEQQQIVAYLDEVTGKIDQAIAQKQEQISQLKEYKQSLINEVVTGKVKVCG